eukprot:50254-Chlamydomonas_euryale.AAC.4
MAPYFPRSRNSLSLSLPLTVHATRGGRATRVLNWGRPSRCCATGGAAHGAARRLHAARTRLGSWLVTRCRASWRAPRRKRAAVVDAGLCTRWHTLTDK